MKKRQIFNLSLALLSSFYICSCSKDNAVTSPNNSRLSLLTTNVWIYDSVYANWGLSNQTLIFVRNGNGNTQDFSGDRLKFYIDGTFNEILAPGVLRPGLDTWTMNTDSSILNTTGGGYSNAVVIESLTKNKLVWIDAANKARGVQIPKY